MGAYYIEYIMMAMRQNINKKRPNSIPIRDLYND